MAVYESICKKTVKTTWEILKPSKYENEDWHTVESFEEEDQAHFAYEAYKSHPYRDYRLSKIVRIESVETTILED